MNRRGRGGRSQAPKGNSNRRRAVEEEVEEEEELKEEEELDQDEGEMDGEDNENEGEEDNVATVRESLASVPFEVLQALKKKGDAKAPALLQTGTTAHSSEKKKGKNQPVEVSSKRRPPRFIDLGTIPNKSQRKSRDPRFDSLSGKLNEDLFQKNYSFVQDYKHDELRELNEQLKKEKDPEEREQISHAIRLLQNQVATAKREEGEKKKKQERKRLERELVLQGKKPFYTKKSDDKTLGLLEKFTELKKTGELDKYLVKKKRRNAAKEHRHIPWQRRTAGDE